MGKYYSPTGNYEVWDTKPDGYYTYEEWKELHPDPEPPEPTKEEKLAQLDSQYDNDKIVLAKYFTEAALAGDTDLQEELRQELDELNAEYTAKRKEIGDE